MEEWKTEEEHAIAIFAALADKTRLGIIQELLEGEKACAKLVDRFALSKSTFSHHARVLSECGLVRFRRKGKFLFFSLDLPVLNQCLDLLQAKNPQL